MPWSQMMRVNIRPPRAVAESRLAMFPAVNGRIRNSCKWNIGSLACCSMNTKAISSPKPRAKQPSTKGLVQPIVWPP